MPSLTLQVRGGLCSRLRAVVGAIACCEQTQRDLIINWPLYEPSEKTKRFPVRFGDIWEYPCEERDIRMGKSKGCLRTAGDAAIRTCHIEPFLPWTKGMLKEWAERLNPSDNVKRLVKSVNMKPGMLGVNIRLSHKQPDTVGIEWWHGQTFEPWRRAFLATDNAAAYRLMHDRYGDNLQSFPRSIGPYERDWYLYDRESILKQAAELYVLAKCEFVIGSNHSSMSEMVAFMRGAIWKGPHSRRGGLKNLEEAQYMDAWNTP